MSVLSFVFSPDVMLRCGVPEVEEIEELPQVEGCYIGPIPILPLPEMMFPGDGADGHDGRDGRDGMDGRDGADGSFGGDGHDGRDGRDGRDGMDGRDGSDGRPGCHGKHGIDGVDGRDGNDGKPGCDGKDGTDGVDGSDGADGLAVGPSDLYIPEGELSEAAEAGQNYVMVYPHKDRTLEPIRVRVPYPGDLEDVDEGHPVRYYITRDGEFILLDLPCA